jgi:prefoldin subunit 5
VISFLDHRVQELEMALQKTSKQLADLDEQHARDGLANIEQVRRRARGGASLAH